MKRTMGWVASAAILAACGGTERRAEPAQDDAGAETSDVDAGQQADATGDEGADIADEEAGEEEALAQIATFSCERGRAPGTGVAPGSELLRVTLPADRGAVCNDGSPALLYIRPAEAGHEGEWVFHLQGGGECVGDDAACLDRWCGKQGRYDAAKMSSKYAPEAIDGSGILRREERNTLGQGNQVFFYYCSSDNWASRKGDVPVVDARDGQAYGLHFQGRTIVEVAVERLMAGPVVADQDPGVALPPLGEATQVLFTGSSGGGGGVMANGDWFASQFDAARTDVRLVMDASLFPLFAHVTRTQVRDEVQAQFIAQSGWLTSTDAHVDQSCAAAHGGEDLWMCDWNAHIRLNHLTTPFFQRQDLGDPNNAGPFEAAGATRVEYAQWQRSTALVVPDVPEDAEERASISVTPGIYATGCGQHIALLSDDWFFEATVQGEDGQPASFHDALVAWIEGRGASWVDTVPPTKSDCAQTTDDE